MREFFRPWRRKIGVCTLVMACVFAAGWIRSMKFSDYVRFFPVQFHGMLIVSNDQRMRLQVWSGARSEADELKPRKGKRKRQEYQPERFGIHLNEELNRHEAVGSFIGLVFQPEMGEFKRHFEFGAPYWSIIAPLTLLSGWLLLRSPPKTTTQIAK